MSPRSLKISGEAVVQVDAVYGDLQVEGWERSEVLLESNSDETAELNQDGETFRVKSTGDCLLHLPYQARLTVLSVHGGARIKDMESGVVTGKVLGSLAFENVGEAQIESVYGELLARGVAGDLSIDQVLGNAWIEDVKGKCNIERVAGDLDVRNVEGDLRASARGDTHVRLDAPGGESCIIEASGDIEFSAPEGTNATVQIFSHGNHIRLNLPDGERKLNDKNYEMTLGNGSASMLLKAGGSVSFSYGLREAPGEQTASQAFARFSEDLSQKIGGEVGTQVETEIKILDEQMARLSESIARSGLAPAEADRIMLRARESSERANRRAQEKLQRAREKLDRKLAAAQRKVEDRERAAGRKASQERQTWSFEWPARPSPAASKSGASDEERLIILRMLEQKKISLAEAEQLLEALEGSNA